MRPQGGLFILRTVSAVPPEMRRDVLPVCRRKQRAALRVALPNNHAPPTDTVTWQARRWQRCRSAMRVSRHHRAQQLRSGTPAARQACGPGARLQANGHHSWRAGRLAPYAYRASRGCFLILVSDYILLLMPACERNLRPWHKHSLVRHGVLVRVHEGP